MSKTYGGWTEIEDWAQREIRRSHKRKSEVDWRKDVELDMDDRETVYVIINEWAANDENDLIEIVGGTYFATEESAWYHLYEIADEYEVELPLGDTSFDVPSNETYETYYIMELTKYGLPTED